MCTIAASEGNLETLQWLRNNKCPWDAFTSILAASNGHTDVFKWAAENGCPWDGSSMNVYESALRENKQDIMLIALQNGCPVESN